MTPARSSRIRSVAKAITWRALGSLDTFVIAFIVTGEAKFGAAIAGTEAFTKIVLYYFHERGWSHIKWGTLKID
ncbi:MAG: DUF2061 domain-containing protein [Alphaproteobacteria bacterium]|nr:DUF2061 domain-containing protein [Alphaproteobacteria bacterium]